MNVPTAIWRSFFSASKNLELCNVSRFGFCLSLDMVLSVPSTMGKRQIEVQCTIWSLRIDLLWVLGSMPVSVCLIQAEGKLMQVSAIVGYYHQVLPTNIRESLRWLLIHTILFYLLSRSFLRNYCWISYIPYHRYIHCSALRFIPSLPTIHSLASACQLAEIPQSIGQGHRYQVWGNTLLPW